jgi:hypothetical protein
MVGIPRGRMYCAEPVLFGEFPLGEPLSYFYKFLGGVSNKQRTGGRGVKAMRDPALVA